MPELNFKNRYLNIWGIKVLSLILGQLIKSYITGKIPDHYLSLLIIYLAVPKPTFSHRTNRESQPCLRDGNHCPLFFDQKGPCIRVESQRPVKHFSRVRIGNFRIWI